MTTIEKIIFGAVVVVVAVCAVLGIISVQNHSSNNSFGAVVGGLLAENYLPYVRNNGGYNSADPIQTTGGLTLGASGSQVTQLSKGTCNLIGMDASQAATSTKPYDCAVTGVVSTDIVVGMMLSTTSPNGGSTIAGWNVRSAHASTTANFVTVDITNFTGAAATPSASGVGSSTQYLILR